MTSLLYGFAGLRAGSALKLPIDRPAPVWVLEPFIADETKCVDLVLILEFVQFLAFHIDSNLERTGGGQGCPLGRALFTPKALPSTVEGKRESPRGR